MKFKTINKKLGNEQMSINNFIDIAKIDREDFGSLCICAVRYCLGRKTYMPSTIQRIISSTVWYLTDKDLQVMQSDIKKHGGPTQDVDAYGDYIDYKDWCYFLRRIETEIEEREEHNDR